MIIELPNLTHRSMSQIRHESSFLWLAYGWLWHDYPLCSEEQDTIGWLLFVARQGTLNGSRKSEVGRYMRVVRARSNELMNRNAFLIRWLLWVAKQRQGTWTLQVVDGWICKLQKSREEARGRSLHKRPTDYQSRVSGGRSVLLELLSWRSCCLPSLLCLWFGDCVLSLSPFVASGLAAIALSFLPSADAVI